MIGRVVIRRRPTWQLVTLSSHLDWLWEWIVGKQIISNTYHIFRGTGFTYRNAIPRARPGHSRLSTVLPSYSRIRLPFWFPLCWLLDDKFNRFDAIPTWVAPSNGCRLRTEGHTMYYAHALHRRRAVKIARCGLSALFNRCKTQQAVLRTAARAYVGWQWRNFFIPFSYHRNANCFFLTWCGPKPSDVFVIVTITFLIR